MRSLRRLRLLQRDTTWRKEGSERDREKESVNPQSDSLTICVCTVNVNMVRDCSYGHFLSMRICHTKVL